MSGDPLRHFVADAIHLGAGMAPRAANTLGIERPCARTQRLPHDISPAGRSLARTAALPGHSYSSARQRQPSMRSMIRHGPPEPSFTHIVGTAVVRTGEGAVSFVIE